jgi:hypothetical protein
MSNAGVNIVQNFTPDRDLAVKAAPLPRGAFSTMDSPYLLLISLVKGWPLQNVRREVLMVSDGIDRLRGEKSAPSRLGPNYGTVTAYRPSVWMPPRRAKSARRLQQRHFRCFLMRPLRYLNGRTPSPVPAEARQLFIRRSWDLRLGLGGLSKIADETGGECYSLGTSNLVSTKSYLERFQRTLDNTTWCSSPLRRRTRSRGRCE